MRWFMLPFLLCSLFQVAHTADGVEIKPGYWQHLNVSTVYVDPHGKAWFLRVAQGEEIRWHDAGEIAQMIKDKIICDSHSLIGLLMWLSGMRA